MCDRLYNLAIRPIIMVVMEIKVVPLFLNSDNELIFSWAAGHL